MDERVRDCGGLTAMKKETPEEYSTGVSFLLLFAVGMLLVGNLEFDEFDDACLFP
jgi:hypothetical protein